MTETTTMEVVVHKANIPLVKGESIHQFTSKLSADGRDHVMRKLNIPAEKGGAWMTETFSDRVVFATYKGGEATRYYAFKYSRKNGGEFDFGGMIEVERVTSYKPKQGMAVTKSMDTPCKMDTKTYDCAACKDTEAQKSCGGKVHKSLNPEASEISEGTPEAFGGWLQTEKSFWMGVL